MRYLKNTILTDALKNHKMAFISGPRQVGKTTFAKSLLQSSENYFTWDQTKFQKAWIKSPEDALINASEGPIILDEIHKDRKWKSRLKGFYDLQGVEKEIIVTGSARLDYYRKGGDSLMGIYYPYRMHPFTVGESINPALPNSFLEKEVYQNSWDELQILSGFPEPFLQGSLNKAIRWSRLRRERLVREDVRDYLNISDLNRLNLLVSLLPEKVGSLLSVNSLREDIDMAYATTRSWILLLESLYHCFLVRPYSKKIKRALKSEPKLYLFDILEFDDQMESKKLENLTALHLLKSCQYWTDSAIGEFELHYVRDKEKREVDFLISKNMKPWALIEAKSNDTSINKNLVYFNEVLKPQFCIQLINKKNFHRYHKKDNIHLISFEKFFSTLV